MQTVLRTSFYLQWHVDYVVYIFLNYLVVRERVSLVELEAGLEQRVAEPHVRKGDEEALVKVVGDAPAVLDLKSRVGNQSEALKQSFPVICAGVNNLNLATTAQITRNEFRKMAADRTAIIGSSQVINILIRATHLSQHEADRVPGDPPLGVKVVEVVHDELG
jgi:hypothetical protein